MYRFKTVGRLMASFPSTYPKHPNQLLRSLSSTNYSRKILPPGLSRCTVKLTCKSTAKGGVCDVYVVGTRHSSPKSCQQVKAVVNFLKPQVVFMELCPDRARLLDYKAAEVLSEFIVASEEASKYGAKVILGDRRQEITLRRYYRKWAEMPPWHFIKSLFLVPFKHLLCLFDKKLKYYENYEYDDIVPTLYFERLRWYFPIYVETYVDERDQYISAMLLKVASEHSSVVAVVGMGHLIGIQKYWEQNIEVEQLVS